MKRYHDRNKSGWWVLIVFVPVIGGLWYLIECGFLRGTPGPNNYGPDPLAADLTAGGARPDIGAAQRCPAAFGQLDAVLAALAAALADRAVGARILHTGKRGRSCARRP